MVSARSKQSDPCLVVGQKGWHGLPSVTYHHPDDWYQKDNLGNPSHDEEQAPKHLDGLLLLRRLCDTKRWMISGVTCEFARIAGSGNERITLSYRESQAKR